MTKGHDVILRIYYSSLDTEKICILLMNPTGIISYKLVQIKLFYKFIEGHVRSPTQMYITQFNR